MTAPEVRLAIWTALSMLALGFTVWVAVDNYLNYRVVRREIAAGRLVTYGPHWWIAMTELVSSPLRMGAWIALIMVGVLGFVPSLMAYRSWGQLIAVTLLATDQVWRLVARKRAQAEIVRRGTSTVQGSP